SPEHCEESARRARLIRWAIWTSGPQSTAGPRSYHGTLETRRCRQSGAQAGNPQTGHGDLSTTPQSSSSRCHPNQHKTQLRPQEPLLCLGHGFAVRGEGTQTTARKDVGRVISAIAFLALMGKSGQFSISGHQSAASLQPLHLRLALAYVLAR